MVVQLIFSIGLKPPTESWFCLYLLVYFFQFNYICMPALACTKGRTTSFQNWYRLDLQFVAFWLITRIKSTFLVWHCDLDDRVNPSQHGNCPDFQASFQRGKCISLHIRVYVLSRTACWTSAHLDRGFNPRGIYSSTFTDQLHSSSICWSCGCGSIPTPGVLPLTSLYSGLVD